MTGLIELVTNKLLNEIVDTAVRQAVIQQVKANREYDKQKELERVGKPYDFSKKHIHEEGSHACSEVLWKIFGGLPIDSIRAIEKIAAESKSQYLGYDSQDYTALFLAAYQPL